MLCERAEELLSDYCEGSIQGALLVPLEDHLEECADCRGKAEGLRDLWRMLDTAPVVEPPADFRAAVWRRIETSEREKRAARSSIASLFDYAGALRRLRARPALGWAAAALAIIVLSGIAVPGAFHQAGLGLPWYRPHVSAPAPALAVGQPHVAMISGRPWVVLPVENRGRATVSMQVSTRGDGADNPDVTLTVPSGANEDVRVTALRDAGAHPTVTVTWDSGGAHHTMSYTLPAP